MISSNLDWPLLQLAVKLWFVLWGAHLLLAVVPFLLIESKVTALLAVYSYFPVLELLSRTGLPVIGEFQNGMVMASATKTGLVALGVFWLTTHFLIASVLAFIWKSLRSYSVVAGVVATQLMVPPAAVAALPPVSVETMLREADLVVIGKVESVSTKVVKMESGWSDTNYEIAVRINILEKGWIKDSSKPLIVHGWWVRDRPRGWTGPSGHYGITEIKRGQKLRLFLEEKTFNILEPNGIQKQ
jgi:hypothetical protein